MAAGSVDKDQIFGARPHRTEFQDRVQDLIGCQVAPPEDINPELLMVPPSCDNVLGRLLSFDLGEPTTRRGRGLSQSQSQSRGPGGRGPGGRGPGGQKENAKPSENASKSKEAPRDQPASLKETLDADCCIACQEPPRRMRGPGWGGATDHVDALIRDQIQPPTDLRKCGMQCLCCERVRYPAAKSRDSTWYHWRRIGKAPDGTPIDGGCTPMPDFRCLNSGPGVWSRTPAVPAKPKVIAAADGRRQQQQQQQHRQQQRQKQRSHEEECSRPATAASTTVHATAHLASRAAARTPHCANAAQGLAEKAVAFRPPSRRTPKVEASVAAPASKWRDYQGFGEKVSPFRG